MRGSLRSSRRASRRTAAGWRTEPVRDAALLAEHLQGPSRDAVRLFSERAGAVAWQRADISVLIKQIVAELKVKMPQVAVPLRVAVTGRTQTPSIDAVLELLGRDTVLARLAAQLAKG